jgi:hypothetical protein
MLFSEYTVPTRASAMEEFMQLQTQAAFEFMLWRVFAQARTLESFRALLPSLSPARRFLGTREIEVKQIVGSVDRPADYDRRFRPLRDHLRERWVNIFLLAGKGGWPPVRVYQAGQRYFVEDGHHRVSVARALEMPTISAEVWEYPLNSADSNRASGHACVRKPASLGASTPCCS